MTAFLLACLLLSADDAAGNRAPAPPTAKTAAQRDFCQRLEQQLTQRLASAPEGSRELGSLLVTRAEARLCLGEAAKAIQDCNAALQVHPLNHRAYLVRAEAYEMQGESAAAEADRQVAELLALEYEAYEPYDEEGSPWLPSLLFPWNLSPGAAMAGLWALVVVVYLAIGRRQRLEGQGSIWRWLWVSLATATLAVAPYGVWTFASGFLEREALAPLAWIATLVSVGFVALSLRPPVRLRYTKKPLDLVEDEAFRDRVADLAVKLRIGVPRVRLLLSTSEVMEAQAWAGGLPAPSLVVTDGVLHRLAPGERDGIVAHEMAHVANGSLWLFSLIGPISCTAALVVSILDPLSPLVFGLAVFMGLRRIVNRFVEPDCDRRAADAVGCRAMASALAKIHAVNPVPQKGWLSALIYATATHPPGEVRLAALLRRAPADDRPEVTISGVKIRWHRILSTAALVIWLAALATPLVALWEPEWAFWTVVPLLFVAFAPTALLLMGLRHLARRAKRRMGGHRPGATGWVRTTVILVALVVLVFSNILFDDTFSARVGEIQWLVLIPIAPVIALLLAFVWPNKRAKLQKKVAVALQLHDFQQVVELEQSAPRLFARDPILRHNFAVASALSGDRKRAIAELEGLRRDKPRFKLSWLVLGEFYLEDGQPERALEVAEQAACELKHDPAPHGLAAKALRRLGRTAEAQAAIDRALAIEPEAGDAHALAAAIALDRGDVPQARESIEKAHELAPGDAFVLVVAAEVALGAEPLETAQSAVEQALRAAEANPFALLDFETSALRTRLAEREGTEDGPPCHAD